MMVINENTKAINLMYKIAVLKLNGQFNCAIEQAANVTPIINNKQAIPVILD
jgi:hypothetical protein